MKSKAVLALFLLVPLFMQGQVIPVKTELKSVKVYLSGAELFHTAKVKLEKGNSEILFENISSDFDANSISVTGKGNFVITSIGQKYNYLQNSVKPAEIKILEDSLETIRTNMVKKQSDRDILQYEVDLIIKNGNLAGKQTGISIAEVQKYAEYMRKRIGELKIETMKAGKELETMQKYFERITKQLQELNNKYNQPVNQITVNVTSGSSGTAEFEISYLMHNASWNPVYDVRVQDVTKPVKFSYTAKVRQNSGINWDNVKIILSSRDPNVSQEKPELNPWLIDFQRTYTMKKGAQPAAEGAVMMAEAVSANGGALREKAETTADYTAVNEDMLSFEFESSIPYSIPSDNKPHSVSLKEFELNCSYEYYAAPKFDNDAFLIGYITKWNEYNFLPGEANTYFQNSFAGKTYIDPNISKDTLTLSLGRDRGINVERKPIKDYTEDKFLSSDIERTFAYEIIVKNNKNKQAQVLVEDQIPVSKNEDITVKLIESSGAVYEQRTGKIKWNVTVDPGKSAAKKLVFSVRHPKDKPVRGL